MAQQEYYLNAFWQNGMIQGTELHPTLADAVEELIEYGSTSYLETLHRTEETVERMNLLPHVRETVRNRRDEVEHERIETAMLHR